MSKSTMSRGRRRATREPVRAAAPVRHTTATIGGQTMRLSREDGQNIDPDQPTHVLIRQLVRTVNSHSNVMSAMGRELVELREAGDSDADKSEPGPDLEVAKIDAPSEDDDAAE